MSILSCPAGACCYLFTDYSAKSAEEIDVSGSVTEAFPNILLGPCDGTMSTSCLLDQEPQPGLAECGQLNLKSATRIQS